MATNMRNDLAAQAKLANGLTVFAALLRRGGRRQFNAVHTKVVQSFSDADLGLRVEESVGKLLTFTERRLNNLKVGYVAQKVAVARSTKGLHIVLRLICHPRS